MPFFLIAWGQQYIDLGLAAIFNASAPLFTLFALADDRSQRVTGCASPDRLGFGGVVLVGFELSGGERAVVGGSLSSPPRPATASAGSTRAGASSACPSARRARLARLGDALRPPGRAAQASARLGGAALGALPRRRRDRVAYLLYFGLIAGAGASKAVLVTYLVPSLALVYGAVFLDEQVTGGALAGLALVLARGRARHGDGRKSWRARRARAASLTR